MYQNGDGYENYPVEINSIIEKSYESKLDSAKWSEPDGCYELNFISMLEVKDGDASNGVKVKRTSTGKQQSPTFKF